ncbi:MAG TPA: interleukin-like EMT inducer domain-containing protein [Methylomirabilota bacterium]|nr:interleukin-like EMT inducer domain-containing protein [Methylomirabilota bacterium]
MTRGWRGALTLSAAFYAGFAAGVAMATWPLVLGLATLWPPHHDARVFTWVMASQGRRLLTDPLALFHGNAFYPNGESLAYTEVLLPPTLLGLPGFLWGNPVLTYNLLVLALWPLNGVAMAWVAYALTGSRSAGWLAGAVFCLSPYFTEYYLEFQMLLAAALPIALFAWVRWLETQESRWLLLALGALLVQGLTTWYYAIILGLALAALAGGFLCLRWHGWQWRRVLPALALGGLATGAILLPFALPYLAIHREFGFERGLTETAEHYADLATFVEPGRRSLFYHYVLTGHVAETSAFAGFTVLALAIGSLVWAGRDHRPGGRAAWLGRALLVILGLTIVAFGWAVALHPGGGRPGSLRVAVLLDVIVVLAFALLALRGWAMRGAPRALTRGDWTRLLLAFTVVFAILALGPVVHFGRRPLGPGPYVAFYDVLLPLRAIRVTARFAVIYVAGVALLAALGLAAVEERLRARPGWRRLAVAAVFVAVAAEYAVAPAAYLHETVAPRPVDALLRADPEDVAVLEWPLNVRMADADAMVRSLWHRKLLVNGLSGFMPPDVRDLSTLLSTPGSPFPLPEAQAALRRIYPLRYLVVRLGDDNLPPIGRPSWLALRQIQPPLLRFRGTFGSEDLYEIVPLPEQAVTLERRVSYDVLRRHSRLELALRPRATGPDLEQWTTVSLDGRPVERLPLDHGTRATLSLGRASSLAVPNVITLEYGYRRPLAALDDVRYRIGTTGVTAPGDIRVLSAGQPDVASGAHEEAGSVQLNGVELAPRSRGYNMVALDTEGRVVAAAAFDTFFRLEAPGQLASWIAALPAGVIVAGAVRDEASGRLTEEAVAALRALGVTGDLRGRFREAHGFVGVKGAAPGTAFEALGPAPVELRVGRVELVTGRPETRLGFELTEFALR